MPVILDRKILEMPARKSRRLTSIVQVQYKYSTSTVQVYYIFFVQALLLCFLTCFNLDFKKWRARLACSFEDMEHLCFLVTRVLQTFLQEESECKRPWSSRRQQIWRDAVPHNLGFLFCLVNMTLWGNIQLAKTFQWKWQVDALSK